MHRVDRQRLLVVRSDGPVVEPGWVIEAVDLEDLGVIEARRFFGASHSIRTGL